MDPDAPENERQDGGSAMERFSKDARFEARMLDKETPITPEQEGVLREWLVEYRETNGNGGAPLGWNELAQRVGLGGKSSTVLAEVCRGTYRGNRERVLRLIDQFLATEAERSRQANIRGFVKIGLVGLIVGAMKQAISRRSFGIVSGGPGSGKSVIIKWFAGRHDGAVSIIADDTDCDPKFIVDALHAAFKLAYAPTVRERKRAIEEYLQTHRNVVVLVDEAQKLTRSALETLRGLHDKSDVDGIRNTPVILFGDEDLYRRVVRSRGGERTPLSPQFTSRLFPVFSCERHGVQRGGKGQGEMAVVFTTEDIEAIIKRGRLKIRQSAIGWLVRLANLHGFGRLRLAARVAEIAIDLADGATLTVDHLRAAADLFLGPDDARLAVSEMDQPMTAAVAAAG